jgi:8-oxo-dGTP pyrophosphatase MutT (NUDIX family)
MYQPVKAFNSLSFKSTRNNNRYSIENNMRISTKRAPVYGALLCTRDNTNNKEMYALVQGRYTGKWSFPKGHSNEGERPIECTLREVSEETGIDNLPPPTNYLHIGYGDYFVFNLKDKLPLIPRDKNEIMDCKWVTLEEMENLALNADANIYRKKCLSEL